MLASLILVTCGGEGEDTQISKRCTMWWEIQCVLSAGIVYDLLWIQLINDPGMLLPEALDVIQILCSSTVHPEFRKQMSVSICKRET